MKTSWFWLVLVGYLLANGIPHLVFGAAGMPIRSPFGATASTTVNVLWGVSNLVAGSLLLWWRASSEALNLREIAALLVGFWLAVVTYWIWMGQALG